MLPVNHCFTRRPSAFCRSFTAWGGAASAFCATPLNLYLEMNDSLLMYDLAARQPQISSSDDQLQPLQGQLENAIADARTYWHSCAEQAVLQYHSGITPDHVDLQKLLGRVPAIPANPGHVYTYFVSPARKVMSIETSSTWRVTTEDSCGIDGKKRTVPADLQIGIQIPTSYRLTGDCFCRWPEFGDQR